MPSWQARLFNAGIRKFVRRESWGEDEAAVARRARSVFGSPPAYRWLRSIGLTIEPVADGTVRGEWVSVQQPRAGVVLYIHGGGFVSCSSKTHRPVTAKLARLTRSRVFAVDYRLAPEHRFPAALEDVVAAYRWLLDQGVEPASITVAGDSAGGGLALSLLLRVRDAEMPTPACAACFSPWTDLAARGESVRSNDGKCSMFRPANSREFASAYLGETSPLDPYASPLHANLSGLPPVLLQVGSTELLLDDSRTVHEKIIAAGGQSELQIFDDTAHGWHLMSGLVPEANEALRKAAAFIDYHSSGQ